MILTERALLHLSINIFCHLEETSLNLLIVITRKEAHFSIFFYFIKVQNSVRETKFKLREWNTMKMNLLNLPKGSNFVSYKLDNYFLDSGLWYLQLLIS